jgi:hypothetical protein
MTDLNLLFVPSLNNDKKESAGKMGVFAGDSSHISSYHTKHTDEN